MGGDSALSGRWSTAMMVKLKKALARQRRLKQMTIEPTMPRVDLPSGFMRLREETLQKAGHAGFLNGSNALKGQSNLWSAANFAWVK